MKLSSKLYLVTGTLITLAVILSVIGVVGIRKTNAGLETVYNDRVVPLKQLKAIADDYAVAIIDAVNKANAGLFTAEETLKGVETASDNIRKNWGSYMATKLTPEESKLAREAGDLFVAADAAVESLRKSLGDKSGSVKGAMADFDGPLYATIDPIGGKITELVDLQLRVAKEEYSAASARYQSVLLLMGVVILIGLTAGGGYALWVTHSTSRTLALIATTLDTEASETAAASAQVAASSQSLAESASEQAASLEETSAAIEELSSMVKRNTDAAQRAKELAGQTRAAADTGATDMREMQTAMGEIKGSSDSVSKILRDIDEIAFQTNILALNAAVEAARAGEAGMGFAVVADEVRNLAQRSAKAAKETAAKIEDAISKSQRGVEISARVAKNFDDIAGKTREVDQYVAEIAGASSEQGQGIGQINTAVTQMDKVTQANAASAEETASASEELSAQAESLQATVNQLQQLVAGNVAAQPGSQPRPAKPASNRAATPTPLPSRPTPAPVNGNGLHKRLNTLAYATPVGNGHSHDLPMPTDDEFKNF